MTVEARETDFHAGVSHRARCSGERMRSGLENDLGKQQLAAGAEQGKPFPCRMPCAMVGHQCGLIFREGSEESRRTSKSVLLCLLVLFLELKAKKP